MRKKSASKSAFFNLRVLLAFLLCCAGITLAFFALSALTGRSVQAQSKSASKAQAAVPAVLTPPLRDMPMIPPELAPHREVPEPVRPAPPTQTAPAAPGTVHQTSQGPLISAPTATGISFDAIGVGLGGFVPNSNPPDTEGRVGATQYVQFNNTSFAVWDKNGTLLYGPAAGNTIFQPLGGLCASHNDGDPVVAYDILSGRWILTQFVVGGPSGSASHQCIAISQTQDSTGAYFLYDFVTDTTNFVDYPKLVVWPDSYYMSAHVFNSAGTAQVDSRVYAFERAPMLTGQSARMQQVSLAKVSNRFQFGFLAADLDSLTPPPSGEAEFVIGPDPALTNRLDWERISVTWGTTPSISIVASGTGNAGGISASWNVAPCDSNTTAQMNRDCVPQPSPAVATDDLDNLSQHLMHRLAYRNFGGSPVQESLVGNTTITGSTTTPAHGAVQWYEFRNAGSSTAQPTVFQQGSFDPTPTAYRWMGSIAMDNAHNIALGYSRSYTTATTGIPGIYITGRLSTDTAGTMGAEATVQAGTGVQFSTAPGGTAGNRWGDYSAMTLDPVDQCTFWYTNEYLKTNGGFNWSTRVASYRFSTTQCVSQANQWGTLTGTITSCATGAPISGVTVTLSNGFAAASDANGNYSITVPAGTYTATAADAARNCTSATPGSPSVTVPGGGSTSRNFCMTGTSNLQSNGVTIDDSSTGNGNGVINKNECVNLNIGVKNNGCATESGISATLTTSTAGVTVTQGNATYPDMVIDASGVNSVPFTIQTSSSFVCGTNIALNLNLTYASGSKTIALSVPTCAGGPNQSIPASSISLSDSSQPDRLGRDGNPSTCSGKSCPGAINTAGTRNYKTFTFTNSGGAAACITVNMHAACGSGGSAGDIESAAYLNTYTPPTSQGDTTHLCNNYLGDSGISGLGTSVSNVSYSFNVAANSNFVIVVSTASGSTTCSEFDATLSGFFDFTSGPGACVAPNLTSVASRMTHGSAGTFDLPLSTSSRVVEPRRSGSNYTVVFTFDKNVTNGNASVTSGTATVSSRTFSGNSMIVGLSGVTDQQTVTLTASSVSGPGTGVSGSSSVQIGMLQGDVNQDGFVNAGDTVVERNFATGATTTSSTYLYDVNVDGFVDNNDLTIVKNNSGNFLP
jgi:hypothetical protein